MKAVLGWLASFLLALTPAISDAQDYSTDRFVIGEFSDAEGCFVRGDWTIEGRPQINFEVWLLTDDSVYANVWSYGWSRPSADARQTLGVVFWGVAQEEKIFVTFAAPTGAELGSGERPGLVGMLSEEDKSNFLAAFSNSRSFSVLTRAMDAADSVKFDTVLEGGLQGSSLALAHLQTCASNVRRREDARRAREANVAHITKDPFGNHE